jgi:hypothetical protein
MGLQANLFTTATDAAAGIGSEAELAATCHDLLGSSQGLTAAEKSLPAHRPPGTHLPRLSLAIAAGEDPLGDAFQRLRSAAHRRDAGAVYTPAAIVQAMLRWIAAQADPSRVIDPGAGSGRYLLAAGELFPRAQLVAVEQDPLAALMLRANARVRGLAKRLTVSVGDYRNLTLAPHPGITAFIGNPPYVRHHGITPEWKRWYVDQCRHVGIRASALAGLHLHFFLQTLRLAQPGDVGSFVTAAEWLDVNYGSALRLMLADKLGGIDLQLLAPTVEVFPGTATTAAITGFRVGEQSAPMHIRQLTALPDPGHPAPAIEVPRAQLRAHARWSILVRDVPRPPVGSMELGELFRVHRGQVTGANHIWVTRDNTLQLPEQLLVPTVTKARDLIDAGERLRLPESLRRVIEIPADLDTLAPKDRASTVRFLAWARAQGADQGYVAQHRKAWWAVGLRAPAPILCTYMGRRPPHFARNDCGARHINIAHGLYPVQPMDDGTLDRIAHWLNRNVDVAQGRTYAGGLTKFEPRELERLTLPHPADLPQ